MKATSKTGTETIYIEPEVLPLPDMHMHTQSNNCCPLPLQWGVVAAQLPLRPESDRKFLNVVAASDVTWPITGRFGKVGQMSTDLAGKLYMHKLKNTDMQQHLYWISFSEKELRKIEGDNSEATIIIAGAKAHLEKSNTLSLNMWDEEFIKKTGYYFSGTKPLRCCLALMMDLSFSHYWGRSGLPIYLETAEALWFINDFTAANLQGDETADSVHVSYRDSVLDPETTLPENNLMNWRRSDGYGAIEASVHLHARFLRKERFLCGDMPFYEYQYYLRRDNLRAAGEKDYPLLRFETGDTVSGEQLAALVKKRFVHIVDIAKKEKTASDTAGDTVKRFEDYAMQRDNTIKTMMEFPLQFFAAYHFDPRRHLLGGSTSVASLAENILKEHAFFTAKHDKTTTPVRLSNGVTYHSAVTMTPHPEFNDQASLEALLASQQRSVEDAFHELLQCSDKGLFRAVKMYPRLGYSPDDFINYPNLRKLYATCAEKKVPLIAHCGPGGMSVHDYWLYERYDGKTVKKRYDLKYAEKLFDGTICGSTSNDSPVQWRRVLEGFRNLKLCLAHFGGYTRWVEIGDFEKASKKVRTREETLLSGKYTAGDLYRDWVEETAELVTEFDNVYTDISCFLNEPLSAADPNHLSGDENDGSQLVAHNLFFLITTYPDLVDRICVGSDWYMIEKNHLAGTGEYMLRMFNTLKMVTAMLVNGKKKGTSSVEPFDAWHQFAVVNPLRYLGLIDEEKGSEGPFEVKTGWLKELKERLGVGKNERSKTQNSTHNSKVKGKTEETFSLFSIDDIMDSKSILKDGEFLILCD